MFISLRYWVDCHHLSHQILLLSFALIFIGAGSAVVAQAQGPYQIIGQTTQDVGNLLRTETTIQYGANPLEQFKMVRLHRDGPGIQLKESILLLPPFSGSFTYYEIRDKDGKPGSSFAEFFALRNYDVYGYSLRTEGIPAGTCEAGIFDCSVMSGWDMQSMVDDITFIRSKLEILRPGTGVVVGGSTLGGMLAIAAVNAAPEDYDGVFPWSALLYSEDPGVIDLNMGYCAFVESQILLGVDYYGFSANVLRTVSDNSKFAPEGLTPIPLFPSFMTNHQVMVFVASQVPPPGPLSLPVPGMIIANGSMQEDRLFYASEERFYQLNQRLNPYVPTVLVQDITCAMAGIDSRHIANLGSFTGTVLMLGGGKGFGLYMNDQLDAFGSSEKSFVFEPDFGHLDNYLSTQHQRYLENPIHQWVLATFEKHIGEKK